MYKQSSQCQEQGIHDDQQGTHPVHVFLGVFDVAAAEVLLHHILVKSRHGHANKYAAEKVLEEIIPRLPVPYKQSANTCCR